MGGSRGTLNVVLIIILVASLSLLFFENVNAITGHVSFDSTTSNVSISTYFAITMSPDLDDGIYFGNVSTLPAIDQNATKNYNGTNNASLYYFTVDNDSNSNLTICLKANSGMMNGGGDVIGLDNETFVANVSSSNLTTPSMGDELAMTTAYQIASNNVGVGDTNYFRFWLDIPASQPAGDYNNSVEFMIKTLSGSC